MELAGISTGKSLISEADKRNVIVKSIKFPKELSQEIADWAHNQSEKYSIWIADSFQKFLVNGGVIDKDGNPIQNLEIPDRRDTDGEIRKHAKELSGEYHYILDWLKGRNTLAPEHDQINFKTLTLQDAKKRSDEWHNKLKEIQGGKIEGEEGEVIMTFPEGFYWIKIGKDYCPKEAEAMGHCGRASGTVLYSLRREQYPFITAAIKEETGAVTQMKGRANTKPKAQFHKYIIPFILGNNPGIKYFKSTYAANTDFNINDLSDAELSQVINKKPSLLMWDGEIALKRLSEQEIQKLLVEHPEVFVGWTQLITLSDILRNNNMIDWAIVNAPELFHKYKFGNLKLSKDQLFKALSDDSISANLKMDDMGLDDEAISWIVKNKPQMLEESVVIIQKLTDEQKDYLVKNHPLAFLSLIGLLAEENRRMDDNVYASLGPNRLQTLFSKNPELFAKSNRIDNYTIWQQIVTPELMTKYIKERSISNDPLKILSNSRKFKYFIGFIDNETAMFVLLHYPELFYESGLMERLNSDSVGVDKLARYVFDHHFDWVEKYPNKLEIQNWNLTNVQKQYLVDYDKKNNTNILSDFNLDEPAFRKLEFSLAQKKQILKMYKENGYLSLDMILGFDLTPESAKKYILNVLENNEDENNKLVKIVEEAHGEEYVDSLYKENPNAFPGLLTAVKHRDVERLKKYNDQYISYGEGGIKIRFDEWSDEDLTDLFKDSNSRDRNDRDLAKSISNYELDFYGYDYSFGDVDGDFDELDQVNTAKVRYLLSKAFPSSLKKQIMSMNHSQLVDILEDPDSISEEPIEYNGDIIDGIKDAFVRAIEDSQQSADENEYWKLYANPIEELLGKSKWSDIKVKKKGTDDIEQKQFLEFEISYDELENFIKSAEENSDYNYGDDIIDVKNYATSIKSIIKNALEERGEELEIDTPYYGVSGDRNKEDINDRFPERLSDHSDLSEILDKAKIVVKRQPKQK